MKRALALTLMAATLSTTGVAPFAAPALALPFAMDSETQVRQAFETTMQEYRQALAEGAGPDWQTYFDRFEAFRGRLKGKAWERRLEAVLVDCAARAGSPVEGRGVLDADAPDWLLLAGGRALSMAAPAEAREAYGRLIEGFPKSPLVGEARMALGELLLPEDPSAAARHLTPLAQSGASEPLAERALFLLGTQGPEQERLSRLREHRARYPKAANRFAVARAMAGLDGLSAAERLDLSGTLLEAAEYGPAERLLKGLDSGLATFRRGRAAWRQGDYDRGVALLKKAMRLDPSLRPRALVTLGQLEEKRKRRPQAIAYYRQAAQDKGDAGLDAFVRWSALYRRVDDEQNARVVDSGLIQAFPRSEEATEARWRFLWRAYQAKRYGEAKLWAKRMGDAVLVKVQGPSGLYWLGRLAEREGDRAEARASYQRVLSKNPRSYYAWRARFRLAALDRGEADPGFSVRPVEVSPRAEDLTPLFEAKPQGDYLRQLAAFPAPVRELAYLGQVDPALRHAQRTGASDDLKAWLSLQGGRYSRAIVFSEGTDPYLSYPLGYYPLVKAAAEPQGIDPLLLTSLVKQESLFDPQARSWVGALGLSQLMPGTAEWVGKKVPGPVRKLTDPFWNLKLGAYYLGWVQKRLSDQPVFAVAAYNAGPNAVKKWIDANGQEDVDVWVELIPFPETRHYVKKVFSNYWTYRALYGK
ncbi:MAG TPA: transglycosylase SLT domain-containing protein [Pantanalinema sp.]